MLAVQLEQDARPEDPIFCEGKRTEPEYLDALKRLPAARDLAAVDLRVATAYGGTVPKTLISVAIEARRRADEEKAEIDEFWYVFDVEAPQNHPDLKESVERARQNDIELAISNPCFELWLVLHFQDHARWSNNDAVQRLRRKLDGSTDKGIDAARYMPHLGEAVRRAREATSQHTQSHCTVSLPQDGRWIGRVAPYSLRRSRKISKDGDVPLMLTSQVP